MNWRRRKQLLKESRLVTLLGAGGIGKTRLALQVGADLLDGFEDGVWLIELAPVQEAEQLPSALAGVLDVKESAERSLTESLVHFLQHKKLLLILDNCEHLVEAAASLSTRLLRECGEVQILATSRQPLGVSGERAHRVTSLAVAPEKIALSKKEAAQYGAIGLFADRARAATESFELTDDNANLVAQICRRLDGIALAIELAAPRLKMLTLEQLAARLSERFRLLTGGTRDALPRQQTMHALIDWSYDLLDEREQEFFRRLCVFAGDFSLDAAAAVAAHHTLDEWGAIELLSSLVDKSLVTSELADSHRRYGLLESMREYAIEKASASGEEDILRLRHAEFYTALAERVEGAHAATPAPSNTKGAPALEPELQNFRAALDWTLGSAANLNLGVTLLTALEPFWYSHGLVAESKRRAEEIIDRASELPEPLEAELWYTLSRSRDVLWLPAPALEAATRACELYEKLGNNERLAHALRLRGNANVSVGDFVAAEQDLDRSLALFREMNDRLGIARTMSSLGVAYSMTGRLQEAAAIQRKVLEMHRDLGDERYPRIVQLNLAENEFALGNVAAAVEHAQNNLAHDVLRMDSILRSQQEVNLATYFLARDQAEEAHRAALDAVDSGREADHKVQTAQALQCLGAILAPHDPKAAARILGYVEHAFKASGFTREHTERYIYDRLVKTLHETFSEADIERFLREGASLTEDQAVELARAMPPISAMS